ncbi:hypothetical protein EV188_10223 [Actinomycetospora succinea]|uniref:Uncharacterized protein n=1 Tax=Actinomycetospora succinea TaxID=663603 RepID=A0A4R6VKK4_9PSEU|nr:hypothetical protein [Actinomycetospora succinea]TDQ62369.1 hypothetical protein EV188_10223 [Actinomycetospora succinea]
MGHHRKGRPSRRPEQQPEPARVEAIAPTPTPTPTPTAPAPREGSPRGVSERGLDELADTARAARRTGWPFGAEILATVDTRGVPATTPPPRDGKPRRYATHQPTAPLEVITEAQVTGTRRP